MIFRATALFLALLTAALLFGCVSPPTAPPKKPAVPTTVYEKGRWSELPGWGADNVDGVWSAFLESCRVLRFRPEWTAPCTSAQTVPADSAAAIRAYFESAFEPYKIVKRTGPVEEDTGLITGYFEPLLYGSRSPSARFMGPLYAPPPDLLTVDLASLYPELKGKRVRGRLEGNKVLPYYTRGELPTDPALKGHEIVWIDSAFEAMIAMGQSLS